MFRKSPAGSQTGLFTEITQHFPGRRQNYLQDKSAWHNVFAKEVVSRIDEQIFDVLYDSGIGRPNGSIRVLVGMTILKEGHGWTDQQLFEACDYNVQVMRALGLCNLDEQVPCPATYYNFKAALARHAEDTSGFEARIEGDGPEVDALNTAIDERNHERAQHQDLIGRTLALVTRGQATSYNIAGRSLRMDSKLFKSNIVTGNRLQLVLETVRTWINMHQGFYFEPGALSEQQHAIVERLKVKSAANLAFQLSKEQAATMLRDLGYILRYIIEVGRDEDDGPGDDDLQSLWHTLRRVYTDHYVEVTRQTKAKSLPRVSLDDESDSMATTSTTTTDADADAPETEGTCVAPEASNTPIVEPVDQDQIPSGSVQSVHDPEAAYRRKGRGINQQAISGYHANITETCDDSDVLRLITSVEVGPANQNESSFMAGALEQTREVLSDVNLQATTEDVGPRNVYTDGGYDSKATRLIMLGKVSGAEDPLTESSPTEPTDLELSSSKLREEFRWILDKIKGRAHAFKIRRLAAGQVDPAQGEGRAHYSAIRLDTGEVCKVSFSHRAGKYMLKYDKRRAYFTPDEIAEYVQIQELIDGTEGYNRSKRPEVESTIHEVFCKLKRGVKVAYRGLHKSRTYVYCRVMWANMSRIARHEQELALTQRG